MPSAPQVFPISIRTVDNIRYNTINTIQNSSQSLLSQTNKPLDREGIEQMDRRTDGPWYRDARVWTDIVIDLKLKSKFDQS